MNLYNMMNIEDVKSILTKGQSKYTEDEIEKFLLKLDRVKAISKLTSVTYTEQGESFIKDIVDNEFSDIENSDKMICDILFSTLVEKKYYLMSDGFDKAKELLKKHNSLMKFFKKVIEEIYVIVNPGWENYKEFIVCSLKIIRYLSLNDLIKLKAEYNERMKTNYYEALMSRLIYGMKYAGESADFGKYFRGIQNIEKYSAEIQNESIEEILSYISFKDNSLIRENPKSIFALINNSMLDDITRKKSKFFYIDSSFIFNKMNNIAYKEISASEKFLNYTYDEVENNGVLVTNNIRKRIILKKVNLKSSNTNEIEFYENMNIVDKTIEYIFLEDNKFIFKIKFSYLFQNDKDFIEIIFENNIKESSHENIEYNYKKLNYEIFYECKINGEMHNMEEYLKKIMIDFINTKKNKIENIEILYLYVDNMHGDSEKNHCISLTNKYTFTVNHKKEIHMNTNNNKL